MSVRVFSGVQPTGDLHLGNYLGAIKQFVALQDQAECYFGVVDLHAITVKHDPRVLAAQSREIAAAYIACGIDPFKANIFIQSQVPAHAELAWVLDCVARMGWMERMVQFKDKAGEHKERASVGLFAYPILMAADILLYQSTHVPVGHDQRQHLNLARDIAEKFNHDFAPDFFPIPEAIHNNGARIMSLFDPTSKMSKSDTNANSRINLSDENDVIAKKVKKATADTKPFPKFKHWDDAPAAVVNLVTIYCEITGESIEAVCERFAGEGYGKFKPVLAEALVATVEPIRERMAYLLDDQAHLTRILRAGRTNASVRASQTLMQVKEKIGFLQC